MTDEQIAIGVNAAKVMHLQGYGPEPGCYTSFVLLQARDAVEGMEEGNAVGGDGRGGG